MRRHGVMNVPAPFPCSLCSGRRCGDEPVLGLLIGCRPQSGAHPSAPLHTTRRDAIVAYRWLPALVSQHARQGAAALTRARPHAKSGNHDGGTFLDGGARLRAISHWAVAMRFAAVASTFGRSGRPRQPPAKQELPQALSKQKVPRPLGRFGITRFGRVFLDFR